GGTGQIVQVLVAAAAARFTGCVDRAAPKDAPVGLRCRKESLPRIPRVRGDADQLLRAVEQRRELRTRGFELNSLNPVSCRTAHHIRGLLGPVDAVEFRLDRRVELCFHLAGRVDGPRTYCI